MKEEVESLGARFAEMPLDTGEAQDERGYARALGEAFYEKQRRHMARLLETSDVVVTTAAVPGKTAPLLITTTTSPGLGRATSNRPKYALKPLGPSTPR